MSKNRCARRRALLILSGGFFLAFLSALGTVLAAWSSREAALREWDRRLTSDARMLAAHANRAISAADLILRSISEDLSSHQVRDEAEMTWISMSHHTFSRLRENEKGLAQIEGLVVIGRDGTMLNITGEFLAAQISVADRDYFQAHEADPALDVFLGKPIRNRVNGKWTFPLARKIRSPQDDMIGLVLAGLRPDYFSSFYRSIGPEMNRITLLREDGAVLATSWSDDPTASVAQGASESPEASFLGGEPELTAFHKAQDFPVAIAAPRKALLREWEREMLKLVIAGGTLTGILIAATMLLSRLVNQLETARNDALSAMEAKARFASNVSHELRTPMNAIIGGAHQLMETGLAPASKQYAQIVSTAAQQLMVLINDILDFSYYEARHFRIEPAPFNVRDMAENAMAMARSLAIDSKLEITCTVSERTPHMALGDAGRISQVLLNLLGNAVKYTDIGWVKLTVDYDRGLLICSVSDTGSGISQNDSQRLFQPFERGGSAVKRPGTGLGLTISKKLVEAMSGSIEFESSPGWGSVFRFSVPAPEAIAPEQADKEQRPLQAPKHARSLHILIAEDVPPSRMLLTVMLENMGHRVIAVENGLEAVAKAKEIDFDLILMDLQMPELDGAAAAGRIRALEGDKGKVHIIAVSANVDLHESVGFMSAGFNDLLLKPVTPARLEFMVERVASA